MASVWVSDNELGGEKILYRWVMTLVQNSCVQYPWLLFDSLEFQRIWNATETRGCCEIRSTNVWHPVKWFQTALGLSGESRAWQCDLAFDFYPQTTMHAGMHTWQEKILLSQFCHRMNTVPLFNNQGSICWTEPTLQQPSPPPWEMHSGKKSNKCNQYRLKEGLDFTAQW